MHPNPDSAYEAKAGLMSQGFANNFDFGFNLHTVGSYQIYKGVVITPYK